MLSRLFSIAVSVALVAALSTTAHAQSVAGTWDLTVYAGGGEYPAVLTLYDQADTLAGTIGYPNGPSVPLQSVSLAGDTLTFEFTTPDHGYMLARMAVQMDTLIGWFSSTYGDLEAEAARKPGVNVAGAWNIKGDIMGNPLEAVCTFEQDGATLGGICLMGGGEYALKGEVKDGKVTFEHSGGDYSGQALTLVYSATLAEPGKLQGDVTVDPFGVTGYFTATPATP